MLKRVFYLSIMLILCARIQGWSEDIEDRFINPDFDTSKTIFIDIKNVSLMNVLKIISQQSGLSFVAAENVADKRITLYLNKIPLNQALHMILDANDLQYQLQADTNVFVVKAKDPVVKKFITKVYPLKYATVATSKLNSTGGSASSGSSSSASSGSASGSSAGGLEQVLKNALSADGKVVEDTRTNSLIVTDVPEQFDTIDSTILKLDVPIPQVLIEVEMIDVSKSTADTIGVSYGASPMVFTGGSKAVKYPFGMASQGASASSSGGSSGSGGASMGSFNATGMTATLNFIASTTDARTLARPRILTLNNETAQIQISTDQAISIQQVQSSTSGSSTSNTVTPERYTTGVILKVTPQANLVTREITMAVSPKVIDVILSQVQSGNTAQTGKIYDPETRGSDSILKLKDGQSMVIGGLMTNQVTKTVSKLPFFGDLPLIGALFRSTDNSKSERELLIFLTPHIIDDAHQSALKEDARATPVDVNPRRDTPTRAELIDNSLNHYEAR